jgi:hypothetical protein
VTEYKSSTGLVWILGRIYCTGTLEDYAKVHALQDKFSLVPLSSYGKPYTPLPAEVDDALDTKTPTRNQVDAIGVDEYFTYLARLLKTNPPTVDDALIVAKLARIGAVYPLSEKDAEGKEYDGNKHYVMHIDKGQFPPVKGFWSLTMYDKSMFFAPNQINRYTLSTRNKFATNPDGSVDLCLQSDSPGKAREANWLPAPKAPFKVILRL